MPRKHPNPLDKIPNLHSRLRMVANGVPKVNEVRSWQNGAVVVDLPKASRGPDAPPQILALGADEQPTKAETQRGQQTGLSRSVKFRVLVLLKRSSAVSPPFVTSRRGRIATAEVTAAELARLAEHPSVRSVELAETLKVPDPQKDAIKPTPPPGRYGSLNSGELDCGDFKQSLANVGKNVLVGIIDVGGIDFAHKDFEDDAGKSRVVRIWDQGGSDPRFKAPRLPTTDANKKKKKGYGVEITHADILDAIKDAPGVGVSPHDLVPQSQRWRGSHGTHVASIAAGRSGVCQRGKIAAVMIALPDADTDRRKSFYDTTCIIDAIAYLFEVAEQEGLAAVSINISLGTNGGAHDGTELMSRWIDAALTEEGRAICVAAGNSGQEAPAYDGDLGFWSGRVHASGKIPAADLRRDLEWVVVGDGNQDISENELEIWYGAQDEFDVELFTPGGEHFGPFKANEQIENVQLNDKTFISIYNQLSDPKNGANRISIYLSPFMGAPMIGIAPGSWRVRLTGRVIRNGEFHAWIERDDPGRTRDPTKWRLPSFFGPSTFVDDSTLSSLACTTQVIGVANLNEMREMLHVSSSQGPTRDGRRKPEIAAPGTSIIAASGFDPSSDWISMTGTSMASPYVTGVVSLMLSLNPRLTAAQIAGIIQRTSRPLPGATYDWENGAGFGVIDAKACLCEAVRVGRRVEDRTEEFLRP